MMVEVNESHCNKQSAFRKDSSTKDSKNALAKTGTCLRSIFIANTFYYSG